MNNLKPLAKVLRLNLPRDQRDKNLQQQANWIAPEHLQEVRTLLAVPAASRRPPPLQLHPPKPCST
jgi:hypothetical protein